MVVHGVFIDKDGAKRCKYLGKKYPDECYKCPHYISIYCACDYETGYIERDEIRNE